MQSMTGYGDAEGANERHRIEVELRSVNSRYLDVDVRLPDEHRWLESDVRRRVEGPISRGRVEVRIRLVSLVPPEIELRVHPEAVETLQEVQRQLVERGLASSGLTLGDLVRLPGIVDILPRPDVLDDEDERLLDEVLDGAIAELLADRRREGAELARAMRERLDLLDDAVRALVESRADLRAEAEERLRTRLEELLGDHELDESRLAQEVAILVDKSDVAEELDRLDAHVRQFASVLEEEGAVGKRLDFLSQEILRELNTVAAKSRAPATSRSVLDAKVACEQLREQVQNVE